MTSNPLNEREPTPEEIKEHQEAIAKRMAMLPFTLPERTRQNTAVCMPIADGRVEFATVRGLMDSMPYWSGLFDMPYCSHVGLARNRLIHGFLQSPYEYCVMIDSDIGFTGREFQQLMEPDHYAVNGVYAFKDESGQPIHQGLGFTRIHRSVFEILRATLVMPFTHKGEKLFDFFVSGVFPNGRFMTEDSGFWILCSEIGIRPKIDTRIDLMHIGRKEYGVDEFARVTL